MALTTWKALVWGPSNTDKMLQTAQVKIAPENSAKHKKQRILNMS